MRLMFGKKTLMMEKKLEKKKFWCIVEMDPGYNFSLMSIDYLKYNPTFAFFSYCKFLDL